MYLKTNLVNIWKIGHTETNQVSIVETEQLIRIHDISRFGRVRNDMTLIGSKTVGISKREDQQKKKCGYRDNQQSSIYKFCLLVSQLFWDYCHGGLSQWGRSNRPRIRPGTRKKSERAMGVVIVSPPTGLCQEN